MQMIGLREKSGVSVLHTVTTAMFLMSSTNFAIPTIGHTNLLRDQSHHEASTNAIATGWSLPREVDRGADVITEAQDELNITMLRLMRSMEVDEGDEEDWAPTPTQYAYHTTYKLVRSAFEQVRGGFRRANVGTSFDGGIRVEWVASSAGVRLVVPAAEGGNGYIYYEYENEYGTEEISEPTLVERLRWLNRIAEHAEPA
jgi:hypothetical protein